MFDFVKVALAEGLVPCGGSGEPACTWDKLYQLINNLITLLLEIAIPLAVLVILYGGFMILTSGGSESRFTHGKSAIIGAIVGLAIVFGSYILVNLIIGALSGYK